MGNQVLSIGGVTDKIKSVDVAPQGLLLFDMTAQTWNDNYDAKAKNYVRGKSLDEWYQNGLVSSYMSSPKGNTGSTTRRGLCCSTCRSMDKVVWAASDPIVVVKV